jgi:uncharacterized peroxidase-related enzyme
VVHHGAGLARLSRQPALPGAVASGEWEELPERMAALCRYTLKVTLEPWETTPGDLDALRAVGLTDRDIVDANQVISYYAYANRLTDGLGVELEASWPEGIRPKRHYPLRDRYFDGTLAKA